MPDQVHLIIDAISGLAILATSYFGMMIKTALGDIKNNQMEYKLESQKASTDMKAELIEHNNQVKNDLSLHAMEDKGEFKSIRESLTRIEAKVKA